VNSLQKFKGKIRRFSESDTYAKMAYIKHFALVFAGLLLSPIAVLVAPAVARRYELVEPMVDRFGPLVTVPDFCLKRLMDEQSKKRLVLLAPIVANSYLLELWRQRMTVITNPVICAFLQNYLFYTSPSRKKYRIGRTSKHDVTYYRLNSVYGPLLKGAMPQGDIDKGRRQLMQLGLPSTAWFVTFHAREPAYIASLSHYSPELRRSMGLLHSYRDFDIVDYLPSMEWVIANGGWVVRLGEAGSKPLAGIAKVIDYANSPLKSAFLDVFLCNQCRFFMGCNSGPVDLATESGVPSASANFLPWPGVHRAPDILMASKFVWSKDKHRYLSFPELFADEKGTYYDTLQYQNAGLEVHNNTPQDLLKLTAETFEMAMGKIRYSEEDDRLQERFKDLIPATWPSKSLTARMGREFLKDYRWVLGDGTPPNVPIPGAHIQVS
jgi:putative glycosyltransferase (TIGR04372 family)